VEEEALVKVKVKASPLHANQAGSYVVQTILDCSARRRVGSGQRHAPAALPL